VLGPPPPPAPRQDRSLWWLIVLVAAAVLALILLAGVALLGWFRTDEAPASTSPAPGLVQIPAGSIRAKASSTIPRRPEYAISNTLDGNPQTVWNSDGDKLDTNVGVTLTYTFAEPVDLARITILNGSAKSEKSYRDNQRTMTFSVRTEAGTTEWQLDDVRERQSLNLSGARTSAVKLAVVNTAAGDRFKDLAVADISFFRKP
jgi:hypothetical protein